MSDWLPTGLPDWLMIGTSSFSSRDWKGVFYPKGVDTSDYIAWYSRQFPAVEIDATFYAIPSAAAVANWASKTPPDFLIAMKAPQEITHERYLKQADSVTEAFLAAIEPLGPRRGPLLLQFAYVAKGADAEEYRTGAKLRRRLAEFLDRWGEHGHWAVEVRNAGWLESGLLDLLREHKVPLALTAYYTMPTLAWMTHEGLDPLTGPFAYCRFIGNHRRMDARVEEMVDEGVKQKPGKFSELVVDREEDLRRWVKELGPVVNAMRTFAFFNNHYAGFGPGSARMFAELWREIHGLGEERE